MKTNVGQIIELMSRLLESESDNDDSSQSSSAFSVGESSRAQPPKLTRGQTTGSINTSYLVQNKLEQFSRRLSMLGLASSQEKDIEEEEGYDGAVDNTGDEQIETTKSGNIEQDNTQAPKQKVPMTASLMLTKIPKATGIAIEKTQKEEERAEKGTDKQKVQLKFQPIGSIPQVNPPVCKISATQPFSVITSFLNGKLRTKHIHCYINNSFAPNPQQIVGDLWSQFKIDEELVISYCGSIAFG